MTRKQDPDKAELKPITIRVKTEEYELLKEYADSRQASLNTVVSEAIAQYGSRIQRQRAIDRIHELQRGFREDGKVGADSTELLRRLRLERAERLSGAKPTDGGQGGEVS